MKIIHPLMLTFPMLVFLSCDRPALHPVPFQDFSSNKAKIPAFFAWRKDGAAGKKDFRLFLFDQEGRWFSTARLSGKPRRPFDQMGRRIFPPGQVQNSNQLDQGQTVLSPDGRYYIWTYSIKTFADDLENDYLKILDTQTDRVEQVMVPALSNGEMFPLFWHPMKYLFYFVTSVGDEKGRSLELWEYDLSNKKFENVGDTNGDAVMSKEGKWILWETGPTFQIKYLKGMDDVVLLCAYDTEEKVNYQLTEIPSVTFFQDWKN